MNEHEVRRLADVVLSPILGPVGFLSSDVRVREDHEGEDAFYVTVHFSPGAAVAEGKVYIDASEAMFDALQERGERRFAYLKYDYPEISSTDQEQAAAYVPRVQNPYVGDLLELATLLSALRGRSSLVQAALRRAVSSAYYAVFTHSAQFAQTA